MRLSVPRPFTDVAASLGVMTILLVGSLAICAASMVIGVALFH